MHTHSPMPCRPILRLLRWLALNLTVQGSSLSSDTQMFIFHLDYIKPQEVENLKTPNPHNQIYSVVVVNHCFTSLFGTKGLLSDIIIR